MEEEGLIARNVRRRMQAIGIGPKSLSLKAGLNETYVRDLLKGRSTNPRQAHLQKLAQALECRLADLIGESDAVSTDDFKRALMAAVDDMNQRDRETLLRIARSFSSSDNPPTTPAPEPDPARPFQPGRRAEEPAANCCAAVI